MRRCWTILFPLMMMAAATVGAAQVGPAPARAAGPAAPEETSAAEALRKAAAGEGRNWGPEQATGVPDTDGAGDLPTAWASRTPDGQDEWLVLEYARPVLPTAVIVHETFHPGALTRVTAFRPDTEEVDAWKGDDPTARDRDDGVSIVPLQVDFETNRVKLYLASTKVPGWNEIDAVGLVDRMGRTQWAVRAEASSTYAEASGTLLLIRGCESSEPGSPRPLPSLHRR